MNTTLSALILCTVALFLPGCASVLVKAPAGDKPAELNPEIWEGRWLGAAGLVCTTKIVENGKQIEIRSSTPGEEDEVLMLQVRQLKDRLVATALPEPGEKPDEDGLPFFRIAATENHIVTFMPVEDIFKKAAKAGTLAGKVKEARKQEQAAPNEVNLNHDITSLESFGAAELDKLSLSRKGSVLECFDPDPAMVFVREKKPEKRESDGQGGAPTR